jgi:hypothetical protein
LPHQYSAAIDSPSPGTVATSAFFGPEAVNFSNAHGT